MSEREQRARALFEQGYNCAQAVALAFADCFPLTGDELARLASSFGGGFGRLREVCGAVSGAGMVLGMLYGYDDPAAKTVKADHYTRVRELANGFAAIHGSVVCREILGKRAEVGGTPETRTVAYYAERPCLACVGDAARLVEAYITAHPIEKND